MKTEYWNEDMQAKAKPKKVTWKSYLITKKEDYEINNQKKEGGEISN